MRIPGRLKPSYIYSSLSPTNINHQLKRAYYWRKTNAPFISQDGFASICDAVVNPPRLRGLTSDWKSIREAKVLFCNGLDLHNLLEEESNKLKVEILISGNSDFEVHDLPNRLPKNLRRIYLQNSYISDSKSIFTLPIGTESIRWAKNGLPALLTEPDEKREIINKILVGPFGNTHSERNQLVAALSESDGAWDLLTERISPIELAQLMSQYRWVAAPRGNGVDTHRLWEALYRGVQPIIQRDSWSQSLNYLNLPILEIESWSAEALTKVAAVASPIPIQPKLLAPLWLNYWAGLFRSQL